MKTRKKMLPKKDAPQGLYLFCKKHDKWFKNDNVVTCNDECTLKYKAKVHVSGTKRNSRTKIIQAESTEEAIQLFQQFKLDMKRNNFQKIELKVKVVKPVFLIDCIEDFINFKKDINVPEHERKNLPSRYIRDLELCCEYLLYALSDNNITVKIFKFEDFSNTTVGFITLYIKNKINANKTYNNYMGNIKAFANYIYTKYYPELVNPFKTVTKFLTKKDPRAISKSEFLRVIDSVKPENGWGYEKQGEKMKRIYLYRPWLIDAFYLGLFAGGRNEETVKMKWSDIKLNEQGEMSMIEIIDYKVSKLKKNGGIENIHLTKIVEITPEFESMLIEKGYEENRGKDEYILAPNEIVTRKTIMDTMSSAFTHFYNLNNFPIKKTFKHLRKTYMTNCYIETPDEREFLVKSGHADIGTSLKHYVDMRMVMEARRKKLYELKSNENGNSASDNEKSGDGSQNSSPPFLTP